MITVPSTSIYTLINKIRYNGSLTDTNAAKKKMATDTQNIIDTILYRSQSNSKHGH